MEEKKHYGYKVVKGYIDYYFSIMAKGRYQLVYMRGRTTECHPDTKCLMVFDTIKNAGEFIRKCLVSTQDVAIIKVEIHDVVREKFPYNPTPGQDTIEQYWRDMHKRKKALWKDPAKRFWPDGTILCKAVTPVKEIRRYKK